MCATVLTEGRSGLRGVQEASPLQSHSVRRKHKYLYAFSGQPSQFIYLSSFHCRQLSTGGDLLKLHSTVHSTHFSTCYTAALKVHRKSMGLVDKVFGNKHTPSALLAPPSVPGL